MMPDSVWARASLRGTRSSRGALAPCPTNGPPKLRDAELLATRPNWRARSQAGPDGRQRRLAWADQDRSRSNRRQVRRRTTRPATNATIDVAQDQLVESGT